MVVDKIRMMDGPSPFETDGSCGNDWKIWLRGFEIYARANKVVDPDEKLNWMLHYAGAKVQTIFYSLPDKIENEESVSKGPLATGYVKCDMSGYEEAVTKLCQFFEPKQNTSYERHVFRQLKQKENERFDMFLIRLRDQAERCEFGDQLDGNIRDQITSGCSSDVLRRKILERGDSKLDNIIKLARIMEVVSKQQKSFKMVNTKGSDIDEHPKVSDVCKIDVKNRFMARKKLVATGFNGTCGR